MARHEILEEREEHQLGPHPAVAHEVAVLGRDDGVAQDDGNVVVGHDLAPLGRELAHNRPVAGEDPRDDAGGIVVEGGNRRQIARKGEHDAARGAEERRRQKQRGQADPPDETAQPRKGHT